MSCPTPSGIARHRADMPAGTRVILNARSLGASHRRLAALLKPGLSVLDVGCGTGAITRGIADAVGPGGQVVGIDISLRLIDEARRAHANVSFCVQDVTTLTSAEAFDIVTAARVLQWLPNPLDGLRAMMRATKPGGRTVVLDYNHEKLGWTPEPPASMREFYGAFLRWRGEAGMDNAIADHLVELFIAAGLRDLVVTPQHESTRRGDSDFEARAGIWADVAATRGRQMVADGVVAENDRARAEAEYRAWIRERAEAQTLYLLCVEGVRPRDGREALT